MVKTPNRPTVCCKSQNKGDFLRHSFFKNYIMEKENTHIPSQLLDSCFLKLGLHFRTRKSTRHSTTARYYNSSTFSLLTLQRLRSSCTLLGFLRSLLQLDWLEAVTKYKLVIQIMGIMILVFWEKSFKGKEADYSNRLARSLVVSCNGISPSP